MNTRQFNKWLKEQEGIIYHNCSNCQNLDGDCTATFDNEKQGQYFREGKGVNCPKFVVVGDYRRKELKK
jgi:hypothetical protein